MSRKKFGKLKNDPSLLSVSITQNFVEMPRRPFWPQTWPAFNQRICNLSVPVFQPFIVERSGTEFCTGILALSRETGWYHIQRALSRTGQLQKKIVITIPSAYNRRRARDSAVR